MHNWQWSMSGLTAEQVRQNIMQTVYYHKNNTFRDKLIEAKTYPTTIISDAHRIVCMQNNIYLWSKSCLSLIHSIIQDLINLNKHTKWRWKPSFSISIFSYFYILVPLKSKKWWYGYCKHKSEKRDTKWCKPRDPVLPMYIPGLFLTGSKPCST